VLCKYLFFKLRFPSPRLDDIYYQAPEQKLSSYDRRWGMATILRLPIPLTAATCANERCIPRGKAASRRPRQGGVAARSTPPGGFIDFAPVARRCWVAAVPLLARRRPVLLRFSAREPLRPLQRSPPYARHLPHRSRHSLPPPARRRPRRTPATTLETPYAGCSSLPAAASPTAPHARRPRLPAVAFPTNVTLIAPPSPTPAPLAANLRATATGRWRSSCCRGGPTPTARPPPPPPTSRGRPPPYDPPQGVARTKKAAREPVSGTSEKRRGRFGGQFFFFFRRYDWGGTYASLRRERKPDACLGCGGDHR